MTRPLTIVTLFVVFAHVQWAHAGLVEFWKDPAGWQATVQSHNKIDFGEFPHGKVVTDQYEPLGLTFTTFVFINHGAQYSDGWGLFGENGVRVEFGVPQFAFAVDHLGSATFAVYFEGEMIALSNTFVYPGLGPKFSGFISEQPFDEVYIFKPNPPYDNNINSIDNLYWAMPIPAPAALPLLACAGLVLRRRRRRSCD